jgi:hypothetical protein
MSNTAVKEEDLPALAEVEYVNAPETLEDAVKRILEVEMRLEDLARACEIASITRQFEILDAFKTAADTYLQGKIQIKQPDLGEFKVTVITDDKEDAKAQ